MTMRVFLLSVLFAAIGFSLGCGGGSSTPPPPPPTNPNASLNGHYTYQLRGLAQQNNPILPYFARGAFTADGNGHISGGMDDTSLQVGGTFSSSFTGTYNLADDGTGSLTFNFSPGTAAFKVVLVDSSKLYLSESDGFNEAAGIAQKQDTSAFSTPQGTYIFETHLITAPSTSSSLTTTSVGTFTIANGTVTGQEDVNTGGTFGSLTLTGTLVAPDANGRGTGSFTDNATNALDFIYYIQNANHLYLVPSSAPGTIYGAGEAEKQSGEPFNAASFSGQYAFGSEGESAFSSIQVRSAGRLTSMGDGNITGGVYDSVQGDFIATPFANVAFTGTYTVAANGRVDVILATSGDPIHEVLWLASASRAYFLIDDPTKVEDGTLDLQSGSFSNTTMNGDFAFYAKSRGSNRAGVLSLNGNGGLGLTIFGNPGTNPNMAGTYAVSSNGRTTASITGYNAQVVFYLVSPSQGYYVTTDPNFGTMNGAISKIQ